MAQRKIRFGRISRIKATLTNAAVAEKGQIACVDTATGLIIVGATGATTYVPIGYFEEDLTGTGSNLVSIVLFEEITVHYLTPSATGTPVATDLMKILYLRASPEVSTTATTSSVAGRFWGFSSDGLCMVQMFGNGAAVS
jgi:hypothetical protein